MERGGINARHREKRGREKRGKGPKERKGVWGLTFLFPLMKSSVHTIFPVVLKFISHCLGHNGRWIFFVCLFVSF